LIFLKFDTSASAEGGRWKFSNGVVRGDADGPFFYHKHHRKTVTALSAV
jgi:hypothetical protein